LNPTDGEAQLRMRSVSSKFDEAYWRAVCSSREFPEAYWQALARAGFFGALVEKEYGGWEQDFAEYIAAVEETAERYAGLGSYLYLSGSLVSQMIQRGGSEAQKREFLPPLAKGEIRISIALAERDSGYDASSIETTAREISRDSFELNGAKSIVANYDTADYLLVFARTAARTTSGRTMEGLSMFLVGIPETRGIQVKKLEKLGMDFVSNYAVDFQDVRVEADRRVGPEGGAWKIAAEIFAMDRVATAASLVGTGKLALRRACEHAKSRISFGRPIGSYQGIQFPLAEAYLELLGAEALVQRAAVSRAMGGGVSRPDANFALLQSVAAASAATDRALQTFGGQGYYAPNDVERYWRDVRAHKVHPISEELLLASIAEKSLGLPRSF
jgi:acyl-CoA dehydrogenase